MSRMMKGQIQKRRFWALALVSTLLFVSACSGTNGNSASSPPAGSPSAQSSQSAESSPDTPEAIDPLGKYDPPIEITTVRIVDDTYKYADGESIDNNVWTRSIQDKLGITIKNKWTVSGGQGEQKMNVSIASGDLPDLIPVNSRQLKQLVDADLLMDLTDVYEKYASPLIKDIMTQDGPNALASATFDGKLMAIPSTNSSMDNTMMLWVRSDWLKKLNLPEPQTMQDVFAISEAFTTQDPDGNGKPDTIGLTLHKDLFGGYAGFEGFANGFHAYPRQWIKDGSGQLVFGSIQPEMKETLAKLQEMYKKGEIDREFGVKDSGKAAEFAASGRVGMHFGQMWNPLWPLVDNKKNDPNAEWQSYPLVSIDDKPAQSRVGLAVGNYYAVLKDAKNPEAMVKMVNLFAETFWGESATPEVFDEHFGEGGIEKHKYAPFQAWPARKNLEVHLHIVEALETGDKSKLNAEEQNNERQISDYLAGKPDSQLGWAYERVFGKEGAFKVVNKYVSENSILPDEFYGAPTPSIVEKYSTLQKMELEVFSKIIMGDSIDTFDKFVADWKKLGGDAMTAEVNEWYAAR